MDFERSIEQGFALDNRQTFAEYAAYVLDLKQRTGTKARTLDRYQDMMVRINQAIGHIKLADLRPQHLNSFYKNLAEPGIRIGGGSATARIDMVAWLKKNRPDIIRGFLTENFTKTKNDLPEYLRFALTHCLTNISCVPDFIAYRFDHRNDSLSNKLCLKLWKAQGVAWTLRTKADYDTAVAEGLLPIFEGFIP